VFDDDRSMMAAADLAKFRAIVTQVLGGQKSRAGAAVRKR
jgi:hypothetical protein